MALGRARVAIPWFPMDAPAAPDPDGRHALRLGGLATVTGRWPDQRTGLAWCGRYLAAGLGPMLAARRAPSALLFF